MAHERPVSGAPAGEPIMVVTGTVKRIAPVVRNGNTVFLLQLDTRPGVVFSVPDSAGPQAALTQVGEVVTLRAQTELGGVLAVRRLDNPAVLAVPRE